MVEQQETAGAASGQAESVACAISPYATASGLLQMAVLGRFQHELTAIPDDQMLVLSGLSASASGRAVWDAVRTHRERR